MMPNEFWDTEPADTIAFINAQVESSYNRDTMQAEYIIAALSNAFSKHPKKDVFPSYEELVMRQIKSEVRAAMSQEQKLDERIRQLQAQFAGIKSTQ